MVKGKTSIQCQATPAICWVNLGGMFHVEHQRPKQSGLLREVKSPPDADVIRELRRLLKWAEEGEIRGIYSVTAWRGGLASYGFVGCASYQVIGCANTMADSLMQRHRQEMEQDYGDF